MRPLPFVLGLVLGCGSSQPVETTVGPAASTIAPRASADDAIVASVNGKPVWGSCVRIQAARAALTKAQALEQCIDFELLAQAADQRGYAVNHDVREATHTTMVSTLITTAYEDGYTKPEQFGPFWDQALSKGLWQVRHEDYRGSTYVRVPVPDKATPAEEAAAKATADAIAAAVAHETGLLGPSLLDLAQRAAPMVKLDHQDTPPYREGALEPHYAAALYGLKEIGRASPAVRTKWGWDIVVWTDDVPEANPTDAEVTAKLLPQVKPAYFNHWVDSIAKSLDVHVTLDEANVARLEDLP